MSDFDLMFAMFGLLLGLAITEVLSGFARIIKMRRNVRIGWLTPLLGFVVLFDLNSFWITAYAMRDLVVFNPATQMLLLLVIGGYYLVSTLIFPDNPEAWPDFDAYYDKHNRYVLGGVIAINLVLFAVALYIAADPGLTKALEHGVQGRSSAGSLAAIAGLTSSLTLPALIAVWFIHNRKVNGALLAFVAASAVLQALAVVI